LTPEVAVTFAQAFGTYCGGGKIVLGRDSRVSGPLLQHAVTAGLLATGCQVIDVGIAPTPTVQLATENLHAAGGIILTASHNPVMWNGLKLLAPDGLFLDGEQGAKVLELRTQQKYAFKNWEGLGSASVYGNAVADHLQAVTTLPFLAIEKIHRRKFKVVADCVNGAGGVIVPQLGCEAIFLNLEPTGKFPRNPEPLAENLAELCEAVKTHQADLGLAVDPDSDRLALVSEQGIPLGEEYTLALAVDFMLRLRPGKVVANVSTSRVLDDLAAKHGATVERTPVGEIHVAKHMRASGAVIGGEGNGGVILPEVHLGRDAIAGIALILQHLANSGGTLSELHHSLPQYVMSRRRLHLSERSQIEKTLSAIKEKYRHENLDTRDGVKILRARSWVQVRASNTEPIVRIMAEAPTAAEAEGLCEEMMAFMQS
jgi:phosphomannomutase